MKPFAYLLVIASWVFFAVMAYFASNTLENGFIIFWIGLGVFGVIGGFLLAAGLWKKHLAKLGMIVLLPGALCGISPFMMGGIGEIGFREEPLTFKIVDAKTRKPIPNALIRILSRFDISPTLADGRSEGRTKENGVVDLSPELTFTFTSRPFYHSGAIRFWDKDLEITAEGYQPVKGELSDFIGWGKSFYAPHLPPVTIEMNRVFGLGPFP
jgi:hypothetical protein